MYNLCCISNELKQQDLKFQTMTWKRFNDLCDEHGAEYALDQLGKRWLNNVDVTIMHIEHCAREGWGYRVSSSLFPCLTHPAFGYTVEDVPQYKQIMDLFDYCVANDAWGVRLSTHPDQFNVLASENNLSVHKTIQELNHHGWVMDKLGCQRNYYNPINIHVNCTKGDLADIAARFMSNLNKTDQSVQSRLVIENEDKGCWTVDNLLKHFRLPITFDNLHHKCNQDFDFWYQTSHYNIKYLSPDDQRAKYELQAMNWCADTWPCKPLFHYSESHPDKANPRAHADMPVDKPCSDQYDWDIELKSKDAAIRACARYAALQELTDQAQELDMGY